MFTNLFETREAPTLLLSNNIGLSTKAAFEKKHRDLLSLALSTPTVIPDPFIAGKPNVAKLLGMLTLFILSSYGIILVVIACILFSY